MSCYTSVEQMPIQIVYRTDVDFQSLGKLYLTKHIDKILFIKQVLLFLSGGDSSMRSQQSAGDSVDADPW